jgi:hypothetical protein
VKGLATFLSAAVTVAAPALAEAAPKAKRAQGPTAPVATARLQGAFQLTGRVRVAVGVQGERAGQFVNRVWTFMAPCASGPCTTVVLSRQRPPSTDMVTLAERAPGSYAGSGIFYAPLRCGARVYPAGERVQYQLTVTVTAAELVGAGAVATSVSATYASQARTNLTPCVFAPQHDAAVYAGGLGAPTGGEPLAPRTL